MPLFYVRRVSISISWGRSQITETYLAELLSDLEVLIELDNTLDSACITWI